MSGYSQDKNFVVVAETRRRWSAEERRQAVEETRHLPVSAVARKRGVAKSLLFRWRKEAGLSGKRRKVEGFVPVRIAGSPVNSLPLPPASVPVTHEAGVIEIKLVVAAILLEQNDEWGGECSRRTDARSSAGRHFDDTSRRSDRTASRAILFADRASARP